MTDTADAVTERGQSKLHSWIETCVNVGVGYAVALASQIVVFPLFDIHVPLSSNVGIGLFFTVISMVRSFALRRVFNAVHVRQSAAKPERSPDSMVSISIRDLQRLTDGSCIQEVTGLACQDCGCDIAAMNAVRDLARADAEASALKGDPL